MNRRTPLSRRIPLAWLGTAVLAAAALAAAAPQPAQAQAQPPAAAAAPGARFELDPDHTSMGFLVDHIGFAKVLGMFRTVRGSYRFDEATATLSAVRIEVETASVFSNQRRRDEHLRGPDFLNSREFPTMVFTADGARRTGPRTFEIVGQLELLGQSRPLTLQATWNKSGESPIPTAGGQPWLMGVSARGSFKRSAYGMNYAVANGWVGDEVQLILEFEAIRR